MYDDILVPTDGSDTVDETVTHALPIATDNDARVHALSVVDTRIVTAADDEQRAQLRASLERDSEAAVEAVAARATEAGLETVREIRTGTPPKAILAYAEEADIDLIVIGTHGKSPREKLTSMGSVSERVVDNADRPVFVVRGVAERSDLDLEDRDGTDVREKESASEARSGSES